ncbi:MAG: hypothetical protein IAF02_21530 [Anaerolineae bacterium]|nr:hypothetical protein [Anaerolineae bacterium]
MIDYLTHYYLSSNKPIQSLSALLDEEAIRIMEKLGDDTNFGEHSKIHANTCKIAAPQSNGLLIFNIHTPHLIFAWKLFLSAQSLTAVRN